MEGLPDMYDERSFRSVEAASRPGDIPQRVMMFTMYHIYRHIYTTSHACIEVISTCVTTANDHACFEYYLLLSVHYRMHASSADLLPAVF